MLEAKDVQKLIDDDNDASMFRVGPVAYHTHDGSNSSTLDPTTMDNALLYYGERRFTLTSAQILALNTTPVTVVPAVGVAQTNGRKNAVIIVEGITGKLYYGSAAYTGSNNIEFRYTDASGAKVVPDMGTTTFLNSTADTYVHVPAISTQFIPVPNSPIVACVPTADPADGNSTIVLSINYRVVSI